MTSHPVAPRDKALKVNLDPRFYGTFAEIGAGQEVVRWFFLAGGAAGTIAKSISAYDMQVSDAIYGNCARYVCRERLEAMLEYEQRLNLERLGDAARRQHRVLRLRRHRVGAQLPRHQRVPRLDGREVSSAAAAAPRSQIIIHVRMLDVENAAQQEALGIVGVNLIYGACFLHAEPERLLESLLDGLTTSASRSISSSSRATSSGASTIA